MIDSRGRRTRTCQLHSVGVLSTPTHLNLARRNRGRGYPDFRWVPSREEMTAAADRDRHASAPRSRARVGPSPRGRRSAGSRSIALAVWRLPESPPWRLPLPIGLMLLAFAALLVLAALLWARMADRRRRPRPGPAKTPPASRGSGPFRIASRADAWQTGGRTSSRWCSSGPTRSSGALLWIAGAAAFSFFREGDRADEDFYALEHRPRISVLIAAYDEELTIGRTLEAVMALDWPDLEVLVVDDGSTDRTAGHRARVRRRPARRPALAAGERRQGGRAQRRAAAADERLRADDRRRRLPAPRTHCTGWQRTSSACRTWRR